MTALTVTAADVRPLIGSVVKEGVAGGAVNVGNWVYPDSSGTWQAADSDDAATAEGRALVVATASGETSAVSGDGIEVCLFGPVSGFSGLTPGALGYTSPTAGAVEDAAGTVVWVAGWCYAATVFFVQPGMALPTSS
ncbi:MAG: hypothetical protein RIC84_08755 [Aggregatilineales bacterium]